MFSRKRPYPSSRKHLLNNSRKTFARTNKYEAREKNFVLKCNLNYWKKNDYGNENCSSSD